MSYLNHNHYSYLDVMMMMIARLRCPRKGWDLYQYGTNLWHRGPTTKHHQSVHFNATDVFTLGSMGSRYSHWIQRAHTVKEELYETELKNVKFVTQTQTTCTEKREKKSRERTWI